MGKRKGKKWFEVVGETVVEVTALTQAPLTSLLGKKETKQAAAAAATAVGGPVAGAAVGAALAETPAAPQVDTSIDYSALGNYRAPTQPPASSGISPMAIGAAAIAGLGILGLIFSSKGKRS